MEIFSKFLLQSKYGMENVRFFFAKMMRILKWRGLSRLQQIDKEFK